MWVFNLSDRCVACHLGRQQENVESIRFISEQQVLAQSVPTSGNKHGDVLPGLQVPLERGRVLVRGWDQP